MKFTITSIIGALIIIFGFVFLGNTTNQKNVEPVVDQVPVAATSTDAMASTSVSASSTAPSAKVFTFAEVAAHATDDDCYTAIDGVVYNLTSFVYEHPGGDKNILRICGKDGSSAFNGKHGKNMTAKEILAGFNIGVIAK